MIDAVLTTRCGCTRTIQIERVTTVIRIPLRRWALRGTHWRRPGEDVPANSITVERLFTLVSHDPAENAAHYEEV